MKHPWKRSSPPSHNTLGLDHFYDASFIGSTFYSDSVHKNILDLQYLFCIYNCGVNWPLICKAERVSQIEQQFKVIGTVAIRMALLLSCNIMHSERWISKRRYLLHHQSSLELWAKWVPVLSNLRCNLTLPKHPSCKCLVRPRNNFQVGAYYAIALFMTKTEGWPEPIQHLGTGVATFRDLSWLWYLLYMILSVLQKDEGDTGNIMSYDSQMVDAQSSLECVELWCKKSPWLRNTATGWLSSATAAFAGCILYKLERRPGYGWTEGWEPFNWRLPVVEMIIRNCQRQHGVIMRSLSTLLPSTRAMKPWLNRFQKHIADYRRLRWMIYLWLMSIWWYLIYICIYIYLLTNELSCG